MDGAGDALWDLLEAGGDTNAVAPSPQQRTLSEALLRSHPDVLASATAASDPAAAAGFHVASGAATPPGFATVTRWILQANPGWQPLNVCCTPLAFLFDATKQRKTLTPLLLQLPFVEVVLGAGLPTVRLRPGTALPAEEAAAERFRVLFPPHDADKQTTEAAFAAAVRLVMTLARDDDGAVLGTELGNVLAQLGWKRAFGTGGTLTQRVRALPFVEHDVEEGRDLSNARYRLRRDGAVATAAAAAADGAAALPYATRPAAAATNALPPAAAAAVGAAAAVAAAAAASTAGTDADVLKQVALALISDPATPFRRADGCISGSTIGTLVRSGGLGHLLAGRRGELRAVLSRSPDVEALIDGNSAQWYRLRAGARDGGGGRADGAAASRGSNGADDASGASVVRPSPPVSSSPPQPQAAVTTFAQAVLAVVNDPATPGRRADGWITAASIGHALRQRGWDGLLRGHGQLTVALKKLHPQLETEADGPSMLWCRAGPPAAVTTAGGGGGGIVAGGKAPAHRAEPALVTTANAAPLAVAQRAVRAAVAAAAARRGGDGEGWVAGQQLGEAVTRGLRSAGHKPTPPGGLLGVLMSMVPELVVQRAGHEIRARARDCDASAAAAVSGDVGGGVGVGGGGSDTGGVAADPAFLDALRRILHNRALLGLWVGKKTPLRKLRKRGFRCANRDVMAALRLLRHEVVYTLTVSGTRVYRLAADAALPVTRAESLAMAPRALGDGSGAAVASTASSGSIARARERSTKPQASAGTSTDDNAADDEDEDDGDDGIPFYYCTEAPPRDDDGGGDGDEAGGDDGGGDGDKEVEAEAAQQVDEEEEEDTGAAAGGTGQPTGAADDGGGTAAAGAEKAVTAAAATSDTAAAAAQEDGGDAPEEGSVGGEADGDRDSVDSVGAGRRRRRDDDDADADDASGTA